MKGDALVGFVIGLGIGIIGMGLLTLFVCPINWKADAVRSGAARWVADEDGYARFEWIDSRKEARR